MKMWNLKPLAVCLLAAAAASGSGCSAFRASTKNVDVNEEKHFRADFDYSDMRNITQSIVDNLLGSEFLGKEASPPIFMIAGVENRTSNYVDTKNLTDRMRTMLFDSKKIQFVNEARRADLLKEQGYQAANVKPDMQAGIGKQLGAKYMLSGSLVEMSQTSEKQVRVSKQELKYYKLTMEVTDLESGMLAWTKEEEFARQASKPLIGW
jgi:penicillin-binding protein activator